MDKIGVGYAYVSEYEKKYVNEALDAGRLSQGDMVHRFEKEFAALHGVKHGIACNSGTSALHIALEVLKEKKRLPHRGGGEVLVPAITFIATSNACLHAGLTPVFVDVDPKTYNIDPKKIEEKITEKTVGIIPVHTFGQPAEMDDIVSIAKKHNLFIIEDCAEAHFAKYKGKSVGSFSDIAAFSTYVAHTITTGIGGVITTDNREYMEAARSFIAHGRACTCEKCVASDPTKVCPLRMQTPIDKRFMMVRLGYSYRVGEIEGALGLGQLKNREYIMGKRKENAAYLTENLKALEEFIQLPYYPQYVEHSFMMYPIVLKENTKFKRSDFTKFLEANNIETRPMLPLICQPIYKEMFGDLSDKYPVANFIDNNGCYIGCHHGLGKNELDKIIETIRNFFS